MNDKLAKNVAALIVFMLWTLVFVGVAPAPPLDPPPAELASPAGGAIAQGVAVGAIALYGLMRLTGKGK